MADAFDPAEFAAFKGRDSGGGAPLAIRVRPNSAPAAPVLEDAGGGGDGFDPAEFAAFRSQLGAPDAAVAAYTGDVLSGDPTRARSAMAREQGRQAGAKASAANTFGVGVQAGALANFNDEAAGLSRASGLPDWTPPLLAAPVGAARMGLDALGVTSGQASQDYADQRDYARGYQEAADTAHPIAGFAGAMAGGLAQPVGRLKEGATIMEAAKHGLVAGAGYGALAGAGAGEDAAGRFTHGLVGGGIGAGLGGVLGAAGQRLARGSEADAAPIAEAADRLAEITGGPVRIPQAAASDSFLVRQAGAISKNIPFAGDPLVKAGETAIGDLGQAARAVATQYGAPGRALAGDAARGDIARVAAEAGPTPDAVNEIVSGQVAQHLGGIANTIPGATDRAAAGARVGQDVARATEGAPTREAVDAGIADQLARRAGEIARGIPASDRATAGGQVVGDFTRFQREVLPAQAEATYGQVNRALAGDRIPLTATQDTIASLNDRLRQSGGSLQAGDDVVGRVLGRATRGDVSYQGLRDLRTQVGEVLAGRRDADRHDRYIPEALYGALSRDLESHIAARDDGALQSTWEAANRSFRAGKQQVEDIGRIITDARTPEQVYDGVVRLASDRGGAGVGRLQTLWRSLQPETREALSSTILRGVAEGDPARLGERLASFSPAGRQLLFGDNNATVSALQDLAATYRGRDLNVEAAAEHLGVLPAYRQATQAADAAQARAGELGRVVSDARTPEQIVDGIARLASDGSGAGVKRLQTLVGALSPETRTELAGTMLKGMAEGDPSKLAERLGTLSPIGRQILFGDKNATLDALHDIAALHRGRDLNFEAAAQHLGIGPQYAKAMQGAQEAEATRTTLGRVIGKGADLSGEQVFDRIVGLAGGQAGRGGIETLRAARQAVTPEAWSRVSGTLVSRMGQNPEGVGEAVFSPARFLTAYQGLSTEGRHLMFGHQPQLRQALDDIATISTRFKQLDGLANPSGTSRNLSGTAMLGALWAEPMTALGSVLGGRILSTALAQPATATSLARWSKVYEAAVQRPTAGTIGTLKVASRNFANVAADKLGVRIDPEAMLRSFAGQDPARAEEQRDEVPAMR